MSNIPYIDELDPEARDKVVTAVLESMKVIRTHQRRRYTDVLATKQDGTLDALPVDKQSEKAGKKVLVTIPGVSVYGEDTGGSGENDIVVWLDGCDGSMPFAVGAGTSTVIAAAYCKSRKEVFYCTVGNPQSGCVWQAGIGIPTGVSVFEEERQEPTETVLVSVSDAAVDRKSRVMIDSYPGFKREGRVILSTEELDKLHAGIQSKTGLFMLGSNGIHHALVANGGKGAVGAITTAIGGPWDVCPVLLVLQAGGTARAWSVLPDGTLAEKNPLAVCDYDIVATGNTQATVDFLAACVETAKKH